MCGWIEHHVHGVGGRVVGGVRSEWKWPAWCWVGGGEFVGSDAHSYLGAEEKAWLQDAVMTNHKKPQERRGGSHVWVDATARSWSWGEGHWWRAERMEVASLVLGRR